MAGIYTVELKAENGYLLEALAYSRSEYSREENKNWLAVVQDVDPEIPSGIERVFLKEGNGKYYYSIRELKVGDVIEFGADTYNELYDTTDYYRHYAVVLDVTDEYLKLATCGDWVAKRSESKPTIKIESMKAALEAIAYEECTKTIKNEVLKEMKGIYTVELKAENGYLLEALAYSSCGRDLIRYDLMRHVHENWLAVVQDVPESPSGLKRVFMKRGKGKYYYSIRELKVGDVIEFGADTYDKLYGTTDYYRHYAVVLDVTDEYLKVATCGDWVAKRSESKPTIKIESMDAALEAIAYECTKTIKMNVLKEMEQQIESIFSGLFSELSYWELVDMKDKAIDSIKSLAESHKEAKEVEVN